ncbi:hypothetical protein LOZ57_006697 [Ophidiomyces ophidiicola]|uniref:uncharacterized protein n=1 Tax=Ophidiomyces ophidiicola TaxID=1387563 RepID=UPI0020C38938|nr:uncharacterized protein LOZ57_006697 [Ophidiomyces ophidiicola]KAI1937030.1 hypothetical protein LOZ57_006697 [Ophidiomyces ophidiicola]KAI2052723.1 hypothetical protein LOZ43_004425 [Ophidiomyces ophidiicola]
MDKITEHRIDAACDDFVAAIDPVKACDLASSCHPNKAACSILGEWKRGSYNVCIPVVFKNEAEKWMIRIPLLPRLAFPEEKMRSEIATMKYITEKTTIPIPRIHHYSITSDNILGLPFLIIEYIEGNTMHSIKFTSLERKKRRRLYAQISDIYIQLYRQQFDRIGALTLTEDGNWIFASNRPLTIDINEQEISGLDFCRFLAPDQTFQSTIDYVYMIVRLMFNDFYRGRDSILNESDAQLYLYSIYACQGILMEWVQPETNNGPFVLMHGDLRPPNIIIDDDLNIISVLDWEWSHTVPVQMFVPPSWLTNQDVVQISDKISSVGYLEAVYTFTFELGWQEHAFHNPKRLLIRDLPLSKYWERLSLIQDYLLPLGLLAPHCFSNIYWKVLDSHYYGQNGNKERVRAFFELDIRKPNLQAVRNKVEEYEKYKRELQELGIEPRTIVPATTAEELSWLAKAFKERETKNAEVMRDVFDSQQEPQAQHPACTVLDTSTTKELLTAGTWLIIAFSAVSAIRIISGRSIK